MDISDAELFLAYRQAKLGLNQEQRGVGKISIARSQQRLSILLSRLAAKLRADDDWFDSVRLGEVLITPKNAPREHRSGNIAKVGIPQLSAGPIDLRIHLYPSIEFAILEILWLWRFGPALDAESSQAVYSNRLQIRFGEIDRYSRGPFKYWREDYSRFRQTALEKARHLLARGASCALATFDLADFYDNIDPKFLISEPFVERLQRRTRSWPRPIDAVEYVRATASLVSALTRYQVAASKVTGLDVKRGIPIGSLTSRVIANLALNSLDEFVQRKPGVRHYGRYVDDIILVADVGNTDASDATGFVASFLPLAPSVPEMSAIRLDENALERNGSHLVIQPKKLRTFFLEGPVGLSFLGTIERDVRIITSERRAFLKPDGLGTDSPLAGLIVGSDDGGPINLLRDADRLKVARYAASVAIDKVNVGVELLTAATSAQWCRTQLGNLAAVLTDADHWLEFIDYAFRVFGICVAAGDSATAREIVTGYRNQLAGLKSGRLFLRWNGRQVATRRSAMVFRSWFERRISEEFCASVPLRLLVSPGELTTLASTVVGELWDGTTPAPVANALEWIELLFNADLRHYELESDVAFTTVQPRRSTELSSWTETLTSDPLTAERANRIEDFLSVCRAIGDRTYSGLSVPEVMLMSRPPSQFDIGYRLAKAKRDVRTFIPTTNALRGTWYPKDLIRVSAPDTIDISNPYELRSTVKDVALVLGNLPADEDWAWEAAVGRPVENSRRLKDFADVLSRASYYRHYWDEPTLLVLPELSVPRRWLRLFSNELLRQDISLVAGLEYDPNGGEVINEAIGVFSLGRSNGIVCNWPKTEPARQEKRDLFEKKRVGFKSHPNQFPLVVNTDFGAVATLICSELLDVELRASLIGRIDLLLVPCWNPDIATFDHELQTAAYDLHCFVAITNNGNYSDCRIQVPAGKRVLRDLCRLISRNRANAIAAVIEPEKLRQFQRSSLWNFLYKSDDFMPLPPNYRFRPPR